MSMSVVRNKLLLFTVFIMAVLLFTGAEGRLNSAFGAEKNVVTTGSNVRLRSSASLEGDILASLPKGTSLKETGRSGEWANVICNGKQGYVNTQFLAEVTALPDPSAITAAVPQPAVKTGGHIVCIDPGHQAKGDSRKEPNGPGSGVMKARVTGGTHGSVSGLYEYQLTLSVAEALKNELTSRGYTVYMTRTGHDVNISNMERAQYAASVGAEISVRLHANGSSNPAVSGALALAPSAANPYVAGIAASSQSLSSKVLSGYCAATGMANKGVQANDTMTGINWCTMPVTIIEMGFMTNPSDDANMANPDFQKKMAKGIADGIDAYF